MKPRLLYILHCFFNRAGTEEHTRTLITGLKEHFDITVIAPRPPYIELIRDGKAVESVQVSPVPWPGTPWHIPEYETVLNSFLEKIQPDLIHIQHFYNWPLGLFEMAKRTGKPVLFSVHDYYLMTPYFTMQGARDAQHALSPEYNASIFKADISPYLAKRYEKLKEQLPKLDLIITPSAYTAREVESVFPVRPRVIEHGIVPFTPLPKVPSENVRLAYVGSTLPQKGWFLLEEAFQKLRAVHPAAELHFYGGKPDASYQILPGVTFHGVYNQSDLPRICANVDVVFSPSLFAESFGLVMSELWLAGVPVAASRIGAFADRITDGVNGKLFTPGDTNAIYETMRWFLENDSWRQWQLPVPRLVDSMVEEYRALYSGLIAPNAPAQT